MVCVCRKQVTNLTYVHQKEIQNIKAVIENYRCEGCKNSEAIKPLSDEVCSAVVTIECFIASDKTMKSFARLPPTTKIYLSRLDSSKQSFRLESGPFQDNHQLYQDCWDASKSVKVFLPILNIHWMDWARSHTFGSFTIFIEMSRILRQK